MNIKSFIVVLCSIPIFHQIDAKEIDTTVMVSVGGIEQFISIKGREASNPILLYLHGGPGAAVSSHREQVTGHLENHFVVVHWDQRGSGRTQKLNKGSLTPSMARMKQDVEEHRLTFLQHLASF